MKEIAVKINGIIGVLYSPCQISKKLPGIILLSGSDGGIPEDNEFANQDLFQEVMKFLSTI